MRLARISASHVLLELSAPESRCLMMKLGIFATIYFASACSGSPLILDFAGRLRTVRMEELFRVFQGTSVRRTQRHPSRVPPGPLIPKIGRNFQSNRSC
jgi:hypothetical protein